MFGWRLISESELTLRQELADAKIASLTSELNAAREYIRKCEGLIDHERTRIDSERERADRIADSLFQSNGLPPTSATVLQEQKTLEAAAEEKRKTHQDELMEIYGEQMDDFVADGAAEIPEEFAKATGTIQ